MASTKDVLDNHLRCFDEGDLKGILSDYAPGAARSFVNVCHDPVGNLAATGAANLDVFIELTHDASDFIHDVLPLGSWRPGPSETSDSANPCFSSDR